jgi:hypothetical protein
MREYLRPWKLLSLFAGVSLLVCGSYYWDASDWDIGVCFVMAFFTYLTAPQALETLLNEYRKPSRRFALSLFFWWWSVDGCYWLYHTLAGNEMIRLPNFFASTALYFICSVIWLPKKDLKDLFHNLSNG